MKDLRKFINGVFIFILGYLWYSITAVMFAENFFRYLNGILAVIMYIIILYLRSNPKNDFSINTALKSMKIVVFIQLPFSVILYLLSFYVPPDAPFYAFTPMHLFADKVLWFLDNNPLNPHLIVTLWWVFPLVVGFLFRWAIQICFKGEG